MTLLNILFKGQQLNILDCFSTVSMNCFMSCDKLFHRGNSSSIHWERAGLAVECRTPNQEDPSLISHWGRRVVSLNKTQ